MTNNRPAALAVKAKEKSYYDRWIEKESVPVIEEHAILDIRQASLGTWRRLGCEGAYLNLTGFGGVTGAYLARLAPGKSQQPEKHLYDELIYVVQGEGVAEIQQHGRVPQSFNWKSGSLICPPMNTLHRLINDSNVPAIFVAVTTAPLVIDQFHNERFVFSNEFLFSDRYDGELDYFETGNKYYFSSANHRTVWQTNFVPDIPAAAAELQEDVSANWRSTQIEICGNTLVGHLFRAPAGCYREAELCRTGAIQIVASSRGYSLMWPRECGPRPYSLGHAERVVCVNWQPGSLIAVPEDYYQQNFNLGDEHASLLQLSCESDRHPLSLRTPTEPTGAKIEYAQEDAEIRRLYESALTQKETATGKAFAAAVNEA